MRKFLALACISVTALLTACGGGGGGSSKTVETTFTPEAMPGTVQSTSYANAKMREIAPVTLPLEVKGQDVFAVAEFKQGSNEAVLFTVKLNGSSVVTVGSSTATKSAQFVETPATYQFWTQTASGWQAANIKISGATPCLHPRKVMVLAGNKDAQPDMIIACHGYDNYAAFTPNLPKGEQMQVLTSQTDGSYLVTSFGDVGYWHGAAAYSDDTSVTLIAVDNSTGAVVKYQVNRDTGVLAPKVTVAASYGDKFTVEVLKVDGDDTYDAVIGGDGGLVILSDVSGAAKVTNIPADSTTTGTVVDLVVKPSSTAPVITVAKACYMLVQNCGYVANTKGFTTVKNVTLGTTVTWSFPGATTTSNWISQLVVYGNKVLSADAERGALSANVLF